MLQSTLCSLLRVVLVAPRNPLNIGASARAMSNFGFEQLRVVNPYAIAYREARSAVGASKILVHSEEFQNLTNAVADCGLVIGTTTGKNRDLSDQTLVTLQDASRKIRMQRSPIALLFGSEKKGLSNRDLSYCHWLLRIPTSELQPSMNLGQAVAVCLYELSRQSRTAMQAKRDQMASSRELEMISTELTESLHACGYTRTEARQSTEENVRRLIRRVDLNLADAQLLLGMLRKMKFGLEKTKRDHLNTK
jgi:tRNA/rRNA methyltransferase